MCVNIDSEETRFENTLASNEEAIALKDVNLMSLLCVRFCCCVKFYSERMIVHVKEVYLFLHQQEASSVASVISFEVPSHSQQTGAEREGQGFPSICNMAAALFTLLRLKPNVARPYGWKFRAAYVVFL